MVATPRPRRVTAPAIPGPHKRCDARADTGTRVSKPDRREPDCPRIELVFEWRHAVERAAGGRSRRRRSAGASGARRAAAHRPHAGVRGHGVPRGRGALGAQPRARLVADAVPVDGQPVPRLLARLRLLPRRPHPRAARRRPHPADRRAAGGRRRARHRAGRRRQRRYVPTQVLAHWSTRKPAYAVRLAGGTELVTERRAPLPHRARVAARQRGLVPRRAAPPPAARGRRCSAPDRSARWSRRAGRLAPAGYRRGYLCGLVRGDGPEFPSGALALEALGRAHHLLADARPAPIAVAIEPGRIALVAIGRAGHGAHHGASAAVVATRRRWEPASPRVERSPTRRRAGVG